MNLKTVVFAELINVEFRLLIGVNFIRMFKYQKYLWVPTGHFIGAKFIIVTWYLVSSANQDFLSHMDFLPSKERTIL